MAPSASKAAGGTRAISRAIISSPPTARTAGIGCFANGAAAGNGFCMATSPDSAPAYAELHCLTSFSFLRGASHPEELVRRAVKEGYQAHAITDECSLAGVERAHDEAKNHRIKIIIGAEFKLLDGPRLVLLAANIAGYGNLSQLITRARLAADKGSYRLCCDDLREDIDDCLALLLPNAETDLVQTRWSSAPRSSSTASQQRPAKRRASQRVCTKSVSAFGSSTARLSSMSSRSSSQQSR